MKEKCQQRSAQKCEKCFYCKCWVKFSIYLTKHKHTFSISRPPSISTCLHTHAYTCTHTHVHSEFSYIVPLHPHVQSRAKSALCLSARDWSIAGANQTDWNLGAILRVGRRFASAQMFIPPRRCLWNRLRTGGPESQHSKMLWEVFNLTVGKYPHIHKHIHMGTHRDM